MPSIPSQMILLPGDALTVTELPISSSSSVSLKLGPGLSQRTRLSLVANLPGCLQIETRKRATWVDNNTGRYIPHPNDLVLVTVERSVAETFTCIINPFNPPAQLPHMAFENVTKKSRPQLPSGALVYARVVSSVVHNKFQEPELACFNPSTGRSEGLGELKDGMVFDISLEMSRRLLLGNPKDHGGLIVLDALAKLWPFEVAVGRNGKVWVEANETKRTLLVGRCLRETDAKCLNMFEQEKLVKRLLKAIGVE